MRPIDADALVRWFETNRANLNPMDCSREKETYSECIATVVAMKTLDVEPVRHGRWIPNWDSADDANNMLYSCSCCGRSDLSGLTTAVPYCWHCGAKMDAKEDHKHEKA